MGFFDSLFGGSKFKPPAPPDTGSTIDKQKDWNWDAFNSGLINTKNPFGSTNYKTGPGGTSFTSTLNPGQMKHFNRLQGSIGNYLKQLPFGKFDPKSIPDTQHIAKNFYNQQMGLLQPEFDSRNKQLEVRASERGLPLGAEAYSGLMDPEARAQEQARQQASQQGQMMATQEHQRLLGNALQQRKLPFMEAAGAMGLQNSMGMPQQMNPLAAMQGMNIGGMMNQGYGNQMDFYNANRQQETDQSNAIGSILGSASQFLPFMFSDRRLKTDIAEVGALFDGTPVYRYRYKSGGPVHIGLMADEVVPESVVEVGGFKAVDYTKATENALLVH